MFTKKAALSLFLLGLLALPLSAQGAATDTSTVAGYLAQYGWTEDDIKPENFVEFKYEEGGRVEITVTNEADPALRQKWVEQIFNKTKQISDDGKVWIVVGLLEYDLADSNYDYSKINTYDWAYAYKGQDVRLLCGASGTYSFGFAK